MKGGWPRHKPLPNALSHSGFVRMDQIERGPGGEERARVLSLKSKSLCASCLLPVCGLSRVTEGAVSVEQGRMEGDRQGFLQKLLEAWQTQRGNSL